MRASICVLLYSIGCVLKFTIHMCMCTTVLYIGMRKLHRPVMPKLVFADPDTLSYHIIHTTHKSYHFFICISHSPKMANSLRISTCEMHCGGEPLRIVQDSGFPPIPGETLLDKRRHLMTNMDHLRKFLMWEPRGHRDMYGCLVMAAIHPQADFSVLFMHNEGYSTMCGHATICLGRYIVERLWKVKKESGETAVTIEVPCGLVHIFVQHSPDPRQNGAVRFLSVPAFAYKKDILVDVPEVGHLKLDISFGGAYYAILPTDLCGIVFGQTSTWDIVKTAMIIKKYLMDTIPIEHPSAPDLAFLYGVILVDDKNLATSKETTNLTIFADGEVDRCPTGSGVTSRMALMYDKGQVGCNETIKFISAANASEFTGKVANSAPDQDHDKAVVIEVAGKAYFSGSCEFTVEEEDPFGFGFMVK